MIEVLQQQRAFGTFDEYTMCYRFNSGCYAATHRTSLEAQAQDSVVRSSASTHPTCAMHEGRIGTLPLGTIPGFPARQALSPKPSTPSPLQPKFQTLQPEVQTLNHKLETPKAEVQALNPNLESSQSEAPKVCSSPTPSLRRLHF